VEKGGAWKQALQQEHGNFKRHNKSLKQCLRFKKLSCYICSGDAPYTGFDGFGAFALVLLSG